jgi:Putative polyhydroxyalkanoic acid system protein (PHA_gran_rgn)
MEPVVITVSHKLGREEVLKRLKPALGQAAQQFPVLKVEDETWSGDRMDFRIRAMGQVVAGSVQVFEESVRIEAALPWLIAKFANAIQKTISSRGQLLLEKK